MACLALVVGMCSAMPAFSKPGGLSKADAEKFAAALGKALPPPPRGWRVAKGAIYRDWVGAKDQGAISAWRYLPEASRFYARGKGESVVRIRIVAWYVPPAWVARKRRQLQHYKRATPHCILHPKIKTHEAWLLGGFTKAPPEASACVGGAQLVVMAGAVMLTIKGPDDHVAVVKKLAADFKYGEIEKLEME